MKQKNKHKRVNKKDKDYVIRDAEQLWKLIAYGHTDPDSKGRIVVID